MPRGYRHVILAAFGWLSLSAQQADPTTKPEQPQADSRVGDALTNIARTYDEQAERTEGSKETEPCERGDDRRYSDLCAQWKAADAAEKAAWWAAFAGWFGGLSFLGVMAAIGLAFHSNWIARDTAKRQLRAYVSVEPHGVNVAKDGYSRVPIVLKNSGQTPANGVMVFSKFALTSDPINFDQEKVNNLEFKAETTAVSIGPGARLFVYSYIAEDFTKDREAEIWSKKLALIHFGRVAYVDAFRAWRETEFAFYHWGEELSDVEAKRCRLGNLST